MVGAEGRRAGDGGRGPQIGGYGMSAGILEERKVVCATSLEQLANYVVVVSVVLVCIMHICIDGAYPPHAHGICRCGIQVHTHMYGRGYA